MNFGGSAGGTTADSATLLAAWRALRACGESLQRLEGRNRMPLTDDEMNRLADMVAERVLAALGQRSGPGYPSQAAGPGYPSVVGYPSVAGPGYPSQAAGPGYPSQVAGPGYPSQAAGP